MHASALPALLPGGGGKGLRAGLPSQRGAPEYPPTQEQSARSCPPASASVVSAGQATATLLGSRQSRPHAMSGIWSAARRRAMLFCPLLSLKPPQEFGENASLFVSASVSTQIAFREPLLFRSGWRGTSNDGLFFADVGISSAAALPYVRKGFGKWPQTD